MKMVSRATLRCLPSMALSSALVLTSALTLVSTFASTFALADTIGDVKPSSNVVSKQSKRSPPEPKPVTKEIRTVTYTGSSENFPNPERGFVYQNDVAWPESTPWGFCGQGNNFTAYNYTAWNTPLDPALLAEQRALGRSVVMSRYHIAAFRNGELTPEYLTFLNKDFETARQAGIKLVIRFAYNYPNGGPDAPIDRVLQHLEQLKPILQQNKDVIAYMEAGFVGCWGEWNRSSSGLSYTNVDVNDPTTGRTSPSERQIVDKILAVLPKERMVAIRYTTRKFSYFGNEDISPLTPLTSSTAFDGSNRARVGHQDDCFVCNSTHGGTYWNPRGDFTESPNFLKRETEFVVQGGEPGDPESTDPSEPGNVNSPLSACPAVAEVLREQHWSVVGLFNVQSAISAIKRWQRDGCWDEFNLKLGYRFRLVDAAIPTTGQAGTPIALSVTMANDGYARPYNPRLVEVVLRNQTTGTETRLNVATAEDKRLWLPAPGTTSALPINITLPIDLAAGTYDVFLNLPDPEPSIYAKANFSIRLANADTWEPSTGYNKLLTTLTVQP
jgi:Domain of unknown function (DUF4832)/Domain of unknown function (DUF4874)